MTFPIYAEQFHGYYERFAEQVCGNVPSANWEQTVLIPAALGEGSIQRLSIRPGMEIVLTDMMLERDLKLQFQGGYSLFELNYCLNGEIYCAWDGKEKHTVGHSGNVCHLENTKVYMEKKSGIRHRTLEIRLCPESLLLHYASDPEAQALISALLVQYKGNIQGFTDTPSIRKCLSGLADCMLSGVMKRLYLESKVTELLALFHQEGQKAAERENSSLVLRQEDIDRLHEARRLIRNHLEAPLSLKELARQIGLNEFKLKKGFRTLFGMTVFDLVRKERMEQAITLMQERDMNVSEAGSMVGYSNLSHFSAAFRSYHGYNPGEYLKQLHTRPPATFI